MSNISQFGLKDLGTRYDHYRDLLELWNLGLQIVEERYYKSDDDTDKMVQLRAAIELLQKQIDIMAGFNPGNFSDACYPLKIIIDALPKAEEIEGGRGTPLNDKEPIG